MRVPRRKNRSIGGQEPERKRYREQIIKGRFRRHRSCKGRGCLHETPRTWHSRGTSSSRTTTTRHATAPSATATARTTTGTEIHAPSWRTTSKDGSSFRRKPKCSADATSITQPPSSTSTTHGWRTSRTHSPQSSRNQLCRCYLGRLGNNDSTERL